MIERNDRDLTREVVDLTGLTVSALARKLRVKAADVSAWIRGRSLPPPGTILTVARAPRTPFSNKFAIGGELLDADRPVV